MGAGYSLASFLACIEESTCISERRVSSLRKVNSRI